MLSETLSQNDDWSIRGAIIFARGVFELKWGSFYSSCIKNAAAQLCSICAQFLYFLSILQILLGWWNACGFLTSVAKQSSSNSLKFEQLLVAWLCGSFSLNFGSKTLGGISVSDLNQNIFLIGILIIEMEKDGIKTKGNTVIWTMQFIHFPSTLFPWYNNKMTLQVDPQ